MHSACGRAVFFRAFLSIINTSKTQSTDAAVFAYGTAASVSDASVSRRHGPEQKQCSDRLKRLSPLHMPEVHTAGRTGRYPFLRDETLPRPSFFGDAAPLNGTRTGAAADTPLAHADACGYPALPSRRGRG